MRGKDACRMHACCRGDTEKGERGSETDSQAIMFIFTRQGVRRFLSSVVGFDYNRKFMLLGIHEKTAKTAIKN